MDDELWPRWCSISLPMPSVAKIQSCMHSSIGSATLPTSSSQLFLSLMGLAIYPPSMQNKSDQNLTGLWKTSRNSFQCLDFIIICYILLFLSFLFLKCHVNQAPGKAEAELALLNRTNLIDAVMTDDGDTFIFGATCVIKKYVLILLPPPQIYLFHFSPDIKKYGDGITVGTLASIQSNKDT